MHSSRSVRATLAAGLLLAAALWGCGDDTTAPATRVDLTADQAGDWSRAALEMVNTMVAEVPAIAAGTMTTLGPAKAAGEPTWDAAQMAWVYAAEYTMDDGEGSSTTISLDYWIQYRGGDGPLPSALGATEVEYRVGEDMVMDAVGDGAEAHIEYGMTTTMVIGYGDGVYVVDGSGLAGVDARQTRGTRSERMAFTMVWGLDLSLPLAGCPSGAAWVELDPWRMDAVYDGQGSVAWTLMGPDATVSDTEPVACAEAF
jgi:hypothetical protein